MKLELLKVQNLLKGGRASKRAAKYILEMDENL